MDGTSMTGTTATASVPTAYELGSATSAEVARNS